MTSFLLALTALLTGPERGAEVDRLLRRATPPERNLGQEHQEIQLRTLQDTASGGAKGEGKVIGGRRVLRENVDIFTNGSRLLRCVLVRPVENPKPPAVLVIHDDTGLTEWTTRVCMRLASYGHVAFAPDLLTHEGPDGTHTDSKDFKDDKGRREAIAKLTKVQLDSDLEAAADHLWRIPSTGRKITIAGFGWGGGQAFRFSGVFKHFQGAFVFYGPAPKKKPVINELDCTVYGFYGGGDKLTGTVPATVNRMKKARKFFFPETYAGARHGFMRLGEMTQAPESDKKASRDAWSRWLDALAARGKAPAKE